MPEGTPRSPARASAFLRGAALFRDVGVEWTPGVAAGPPLYPQPEERFRNGVESSLCAVARRSDHRTKKRRNYKFCGKIGRTDWQSCKFCGEMGSAGLIQVRELRRPRSGLGQFPAFP